MIAEEPLPILALPPDLRTLLLGRLALLGDRDLLVHLPLVPDAAGRRDPVEEKIERRRKIAAGRDDVLRGPVRRSRPLPGRGDLPGILRGHVVMVEVDEADRGDGV